MFEVWRDSQRGTKAVTADKRTAKEEFKVRVSDYTRTFGTQHGQRVLADLIKTFGGDTFNENPFVMAARAGERRPILRIKQYLLRGKNLDKYLPAFEESEKEESVFILPMLESNK